MPRLTINLTDEQFNKIKTYAENKSMSLSHYSRTLLNIGLRVEQAVNEAQPSQANIMGLNISEYPWKTLLTWALESRYLMRYLVAECHYETGEQRKYFLKEAKEKAGLRITERFGHLFSTE